jgi:DNA polymerase eta
MVFVIKPKLNNPILLEKASIDEAFIDFTRPVRNTILERFPYLRTVPPDAPFGADSPLPPPPPIIWNEEHGTLVPLQPSHQDNNRGSGEDDDNSENGRYDEDDARTTWHDVALSIAAEMMNRIRGDIKKKIGYTTTAVSNLAPNAGVMLIYS